MSHIEVKPRTAPGPQQAQPTKTSQGSHPGPSGDGAAAAISEDKFFSVEIRPVAKGQRLDVEQVRDEREGFYLAFIWAANVLVPLAIIAIVVTFPESLATLAISAVSGGLLIWISWKLTLAFIYGNSIEVGPHQYPQLYRVVKQAADYLNIAMPTILILQGHGIFDLIVARRFTRRGLILLTSNMIDEFCMKPSSREFMMLVGRQLGHIKAGHFHFWFLKDVIGRASLFFHWAWWRRCQLTADRIGLLAAGNLYAAEQALILITAGARIAPSTNFDAIEEQRAKLFDSFWSWIRLGCSSYPYVVDRIVRLREFAVSIGMKPEVGGLPIDHTSLRAVPILIIHGHDKVARLELENLLYAKFPYVAPRVMLAEHAGSLSMSEKFERISRDLVGAIALLTPDDIGGAVRAQGVTTTRARQNVVIEIGWVWGRLGRQKCLLLTRGDVELPSDLSGVDVQAFNQSPSECLLAVQAFLDHLIKNATNVTGP